jgi:ABC-type uncharacterized transport system permease subunit
MTITLKISKKYSSVLLALFMSIAMSFSMSLAMTIINLGFSPDFLIAWVFGFTVGVIVAFPTSLAVMPTVRKLVGKLTQD